MDLRKLSALFQDRVEDCKQELLAALQARGGHELLPPLLANLYGSLFEVSHRTLVAQYRLVEADIGFDDYCASLREPDVSAYLYRRYPVLKRWIAATCDAWLTQSRLLAERLIADMSEWQRLLPDAQLHDVHAIRLGLGDAHRGGRSVTLLEFRDGRKLVYKPRSLAIDTHFSDMLQWANEKCQLELASILHIDKGNYGWVEFIAPKECADAAAVDRYYERLGGLLALLYALEGTDFHYENLIAAGEQPMLIDLESFFRPVSPICGTEANESIDASVLKIGILPTRFLGAGDLPEVGGIADAAGQPGLERMIIVEDSDGRPRLARQSSRLTGAQNIPQLNGTNVVPSPAHVARLQAGFSAIYRAITAHREEFKALASRCRSDQIRVIFRHTATYVHLLNEAKHPSLLMSDEAIAQHFGLLRMAAATHKVAERFVDFEISDLQRGDVPQFTTEADSCDLWYSDSGRIEGFFQESGYRAALRKIDQLSESDLSRQLWIIGNAMSMHEMASRAASRPCSAAGENDARPLRERLVDQAIAIAEQLRPQIHVNDGLASWLVYKSRALNNSEFQATPAFYDLHSGMPGEILFFSQLARATGNREYRELSHQALRYLMTRVRESKAAIRPLGLYAGWGSLLLLLTRLAEAESNFEYLQWAEELLEGPDFDRLLQIDTHYGLILGSAGFILACVELHASNGSPRALQLAEDAAAHLLSHRHVHGPGFSWKIASERPLAGLAHGASGFAMAFARLFEATGRDCYREASLQAIEYEHSLFVPEAGNWRDCRDVVIKAHGERPVCALSWAHGAPGTGLARLAMLRAGIESEQVRQDLHVAVATTRASGFAGGHSLIGGAFGNLELLICHAACFGSSVEPELDVIASRLLAQLAQADARLSSPMRHPPGLMAGIAGIGYQCLRLALRQQVPSVLCGTDYLPLDARRKAAPRGAAVNSLLET